MEESLYLSVAALGGFCVAFLAGAAVFESAALAYRASSATLGVSAEKRGSNAASVLFRYYIRNGIPLCNGFARWMLRLAAIRRFFEDASSLLGNRGLIATPAGLGSFSAGVAGFVSVLALIVFQSPMSAFLVPLCLALVCGAAVARGRARERELLRDQVPDALRCMEACLHAGLSLPQAFSEVSKEMDKPAKDAFASVSRDLDLGFSVEQALERFRDSSHVAELAFVAMALDVQYVCGGDATPVLRSAEESVSRSLELKRSLRVQTAQSRFSAQIVSIMPVFLLTALSILSPGFLSPFFTSDMGPAILACAVGMQLTGMALVRKMLAVEL